MNAKYWIEIEIPTDTILETHLDGDKLVLYTNEKIEDIFGDEISYKDITTLVAKQVKIGHIGE